MRLYIFQILYSCAIFISENEVQPSPQEGIDEKMFLAGVPRKCFGEVGS